MRDYIKEYKAREKYNLSKFQLGGKMDWTKSDWYNSPAASILKIIDPTGISSYGDVYNAWTDDKFDYQDILAPIGALPLVGKFGKLGKVGELSKALEVSKNPKLYTDVVKVGGRTLRKTFNTVPKYTKTEVTAAKDFISNNKKLNTFLLGTRIANIAGDIDNSTQLASTVLHQKGGVVKRGEEQPAIQPARNPVKQFFLNVAGGWEHNKPHLLKDVPILDYAVQPTLDYLAGKGGEEASLSILPGLGKVKDLLPGANKVGELVGRAQDNLKWIDKGLGDILEGRKFRETFPILKKDKAKILSEQKKEALEGMNFVKDWLYDPNGNLRKEVADRIHNLNPRSTTSPYITPSRYEINAQNPLVSTKNHLVQTTTKGVKNSLVTPGNKEFLKEYRGTFHGLNDWTPDETVVVASHSRYARKPVEVGQTSTHETAHAIQSLGRSRPGAEGWSRHIAELTGDHRTPTEDTWLGRLLKDNMVEGGWHGSPLELHSELMVSRKELQDILMKKGYTKEEAIQRMQAGHEKDINKVDATLDRFFKPEASKEDRLRILRALPVAAGAAIGLDKLNNNNSKK